MVTRLVTAEYSVPRIVIAGTNSGAGKTTVTSGLCRILCRLGLRVSVFKCGPDYLDLTYHSRAAGVPSRTLDGWMMGRAGVLSTFEAATRDSDVAVIEGVMGLFDGVEPTSDVGSTAEIAKWLAVPVVLVVDASGMSRSVAAMTLGFASFDPDLRVAGVICNRVGSKTHLEMLKAASTSVPVLGGLPKDEEHSFPERHLGLRTANDLSLPDNIFEVWATHITQWCDVDQILEIARRAPTLVKLPRQRTRVRPVKCRIGVASDQAFHFYYDENLRLLEEAGAQLVSFSPMNTAHLPELDGLYLGGGYPEVHAAALEQNKSLRNDVLEFCRGGKPVYAECGGLMYLCSGIRQTDGSRHSMVGWFEADAVMSNRMQALGYVEVTTNETTVLGLEAQRFRGHQFRYSSLEWTQAADTAYVMRKRRDGQPWNEGYVKGKVLASYVHAHWASSPSLAQAFVDVCSLGRY